MRRISAALHAVDGDRGNEKPAGPCLGHIGYYPNAMVHDQSERLLGEINVALRVDIHGVLKDNPSPDYTHIKLIRYTEQWLVYELSYISYPEGARQRDMDAQTTTHRYILIKQ